MRTIHKVVLDPSVGIYTEALKGFIHWLDAGVQDGQLVAWAEVDTEGDRDLASPIAVEWTGQPSVRDQCGLPYWWRLLRSVQVGMLVCHVFAHDQLLKDERGEGDDA